MALTVQKLNADTTFLLTFAPTGDIPKHSHPKRIPGSFTILVDPWLRGQSSLLHPSFQISYHTTPSPVTSLADIKQDIDLIIISQDKPDHCHHETLCSWPREKRVNILATPAAAKKIRSWCHFDEACIHELPSYSPAHDDSMVRLGIAAYTKGARAGEISIANLTTRKDLTGLHNAIAITYRAPTTDLTNNYGDGKDVAVFTPPDSPIQSQPSMVQPGGEHKSLRSRVRSAASLRTLARRRSRPQLAESDNAQHPATPPHTPPLDACVSCIYTPHGVSPSILEPYIQHHLAAQSALPLTLLIHSMVMERNPWYLGGVVAAGAPGGIETIKLLGGNVKVWLGAHDEEKYNAGLSVKWIKSRRYNLEEVRELLVHAQYQSTELREMDPGEVMRISG